MKIKIVSDLHLEFFGMELPNNGADVLILSGDIMVADNCRYNTRYQKFFDQIHTDYKKIVYIPGNHEHYHGHMSRTDAKIKEFLEDYPDVHYLNNDWTIIDGNVFIGTTLWSDINKRDPLSTWSVRNVMNDFQLVRNGSNYRRYTPDDWIENHIKALDYVSKVYKDTHDKYKKIVLCGHHAPSYQSIDARYKDDHHVNGCYASDLENFILERDKIVLWTHGHVHSSFDYNIGNTRVVCNPRGYANAVDSENFGFEPDKIVEI